MLLLTSVLALCSGAAMFILSRVCNADLNDGKSSVLVEGRDFYSNPALSDDGSKLAWVCWDHPSM